MFEQLIETSATPHITIRECLGELVVRGSEEGPVTLRLPDEVDLESLEQEGDAISLAVRSGCRLTCPTGAALTVHVARGDVKISDVGGAIALGAVNGNVALRRVGSAGLERVHGDVHAREVDGDLQMQSVQGDARVRAVAGGLQIQALQGDARVQKVDGALSADWIGGDLRAEELHGGLEAEAGADIRLGPPFQPGATYRVRAGGGVWVYLPEDSSLRLSLQAGGRIRCRVPELALEESDGTTEGTMGGGEATLEAQAAGPITLRPADSATTAEEETDWSFVMPDLEGLSSLIETRVSEAMAEMQTRLDDSLAQVDSEAIRQRMERAGERTRQQAEKAAEKARVHMEREYEHARREAEREAERARMHADRARRRWQRASGQRPRPRPQPATDEERLRVLHMVEQGKLTPEQASDLLAALEGK
jgi:hypothetical protein